MMWKLCLLAGFLCGLTCAETQAGPCEDMDTQSCVGFHKVKPDLCSEPTFYETMCKRFCGQCPVKCYSCPHPVRNPSDCNTTTTCGPNMLCMTKHLRDADGHLEYLMTCETKEVCDLLTDGFGKRSVNSERRDRPDRAVTLECCIRDGCNAEIQTTTAATTTTPTTHKPPTTTRFCDSDNCFMGLTSAHGQTSSACHKDVVFAVDESGSVGPTNFRHMMDFVSQVVSKLNIRHDGGRVALVTYASTPKVHWYLNSFTTEQQLTSALRHVQYQGGGSRTDLVLEAITSTVLTSMHGDRGDASNVVVLLTDGRSTIPSLTAEKAKILHNYNLDIVAIGIGSGVDGHELGTIATDGHHVFTIHGFHYLTHLIPDLVNIICN